MCKDIGNMYRLVSMMCFNCKPVPTNNINCSCYLKLI